MKKILVTGGSGFIGTNLIDSLEDEKCEILNLDIVSPRNKKHTCYWKYVDICNLDQLKSEINFFSFPPHSHFFGNFSLIPRRISCISSHLSHSNS